MFSIHEQSLLLKNLQENRSQLRSLAPARMLSRRAMAPSPARKWTRTRVDSSYPCVATRLIWAVRARGWSAIVLSAAGAARWGLRAAADTLPSGPGGEAAAAARAGIRARRPLSCALGTAAARCRRGLGPRLVWGCRRPELQVTRLAAAIAGAGGAECAAATAGAGGAGVRGDAAAGRTCK
jgi:hypothetical protein